MISSAHRFGAYGEAGTSAGRAIEQTTKLTPEQIAEMTKLGIDIAQDVTGTPYKRYELAKADLQSAIANGRSLSVILDKQAKLAAAQRSVQEYENTQASRWEWAVLGKTALAVGVGIGGMVIALQFRNLLRG